MPKFCPLTFENIAFYIRSALRIIVKWNENRIESYFSLNFKSNTFARKYSIFFDSAVFPTVDFTNKVEYTDSIRKIP